MIYHPNSTIFPGKFSKQKHYMYYIPCMADALSGPFQLVNNKNYKILPLIS